MSKDGYGQLSTFEHYARKQLPLYRHLKFFYRLLNDEEFINVELHSLRAIDSVIRLFSHRSETISKYQYKYVYTLVKFLLP